MRGFKVNIGEAMRKLKCPHAHRWRWDVICDIFNELCPMIHPESPIPPERCPLHKSPMWREAELEGDMFGRW